MLKKRDEKVIQTILVISSMHCTVYLFTLKCFFAKFYFLLCTFQNRWHKQYDKHMRIFFCNFCQKTINMGEKNTVFQ